MGKQKLLVSIRGTPMIDRVLAAAAAYDTIVVASPEIARAISAREGLRVVENGRPGLGMAHSLGLAEKTAAPATPLLVFLGDKPFVTAALAKQIAEGALRSGADVVFPERAGVGGHPVFFSVRARAKIGGTGDSLRDIRDDPALRRLALPIDDDGAYIDIDDPAALLLFSK